MSQNRKNQKNTKPRTSLPRNVLRVDFAPRVVGLIHRGHVDVGVGVVRDHKLRDRFEETHFIFEGAVYIRLTSEIVSSLDKEGSYSSYILSIVKDAGKVAAKMDLNGVKSEVTFDQDALKRIRSFLANGAAMGNVIARFLDGADPQELIDAARRNQPQRQPQQRGRHKSSAVLEALEKGPRKPSGNAPGGMGTLGSVHGQKLEAAKKDMSRKQKAKFDSGNAEKKAEAPEPKPSEVETELNTELVESFDPDPAPTETVTTVEVVAEKKATITAKQARMYLSTLEKNGGDLDALPVSPENLKAIREAAKEAGIVLKETKHLIQ